MVSVPFEARSNDDGKREQRSKQSDDGYLVKKVVCSCHPLDAASMELLWLCVDGEASGIWVASDESRYVLSDVATNGTGCMVSSTWDISAANLARRVYSITQAGEVYLKCWAESLDQYQKMMNTFFELYTLPIAQRKKEDD